MANKRISKKIEKLDIAIGEAERDVNSWKTTWQVYKEVGSTEDADAAYKALLNALYIRTLLVIKRRDLLEAKK